MAENTIVIVGDSLSAAYGIEQQQGWVSLLQTRLRQEKFSYVVINASISGDTTSNGLARLPPILQMYKPLITVIELGANDGLRGLEISHIKRNLAQMILMAKQAKSKVLILGMRLPPNYGPVYTNAFQQIFTDLAKQYEVSIVPLFLKGVDENRALFQPDTFHPDATAQVIILNNVWSVLKTLLTKNK